MLNHLPAQKRLDHSTSYGGFTFASVQEIVNEVEKARADLLQAATVLEQMVPPTIGKPNVPAERLKRQRAAMYIAQRWLTATTL